MMTDLIDRQELLKLFEKDGDFFVSQDIRHIIETGVKTADPTIHGCWKILDPDHELTSSVWYICSECGKLAPVERISQWIYCPKCGAKMGREVTDSETD